MMRQKTEISEKEFLKNVKIREALDDDEQWSDYKDNAKREGDPIKFYRSGKTHFFQRAGFEFIWR